MRLFHVSEQSDIQRFEPRPPTRPDLDPNVGLVWAIREDKLPNFLTPRDCPRVAYSVGASTTAEDRARFFSSSAITHAVVIESRWFERMGRTTLYLYAFDPADFTLQDAAAGYYVARRTQIPTGKRAIGDLFAELFARQVELRVVDNLWDMADQVQTSSLDWSLCRMAHARPRSAQAR